MLGACTLGMQPVVVPVALKAAFSQNRKRQHSKIPSWLIIRFTPSSPEPKPCPARQIATLIAQLSFLEICVQRQDAHEIVFCAFHILRRGVPVFGPSVHRNLQSMLPFS